jgi:hypothetical protein
MKSPTLAFFALAGLASGATVTTVTNSSNCYAPQPDIVGGSNHVSLFFEAAVFSFAPGTFCMATATAYFQADIFGAGMLNITETLDPTEPVGGLFYDGTPMSCFTTCSFAFSDETVFQIVLTVHVLIDSQGGDHFTTVGAILTTSGQSLDGAPLTEVTSLPEPGALALTLAGLGALWWRRRTFLRTPAQLALPRSIDAINLIFGKIRDNDPFLLELSPLTPPTSAKLEVAP